MFRKRNITWFTTRIVLTRNVNLITLGKHDAGWKDGQYNTTEPTRIRISFNMQSKRNTAEFGYRTLKLSEADIEAILKDALVNSSLSRH